jgi:hypothetical protein
LPPLQGSIIGGDIELLGTLPPLQPSIQEAEFLTIQLPPLQVVMNDFVNLTAWLQDNDTLNLVATVLTASPFVITSTPVTELTQYNQYYYQITISSDYPNASASCQLLTSSTWLEIDSNNVLRGYSYFTGSFDVQIEVTDGFDTLLHEFTIEVVAQTEPTVTPAWSISTTQTQITLAIVTCYNRVKKQLETLYFGTTGYNSLPTDNPANQHFSGYIKDTVRFEHSISAAMDASADLSYGRLVLYNLTGALDKLITEYTFGYRRLKLYRGEPTAAFADFKLILDGVIDRNGVSTNDGIDIEFDIYDKRKLLEVPIQTELLTEDSFPPVAFGSCFNVPGVITDEVNLIYKLNYTKIKNITEVRDAGASFTDLRVSGFNDYTSSNQEATLQLESPPFGDITFDIQGTVDASGWYPETAADIVKYLILNHTSLTVADLDLESFSYFNQLCPQKLCYYSNEKVEVAEVITEILSTVGGYLVPKRSDGKFKLLRFENPSGTERLEIADIDIKADGFYPTRIISPIESLLLGYKRNYSPIDRNSQAEVTFIPTNKSIELSKEWGKRLLLRNKNILEIYADAIIFDENEAAQNGLIPTNFTNKADTLAEGLRRVQLYGYQRIVYNVSGFDKLLPLELGDVIKITHKRFGFGNGLLVVVLNIREEPDGVVLEVFR